MAQTSSSLPSTPDEFVELAWRRKWIILVPFLVVAGAASFLAYALPAVYQASTTILVVRAKVPETFVKSTVTSQIEDRLATVTEQILSRTRLEHIIRQFDLYREELATQPMDAVVARMRRAIAIEVLKGNNAFTVSFSGSEPRVVRDVTNDLAAFFIEENSRVREEAAAGTSEFLDAQLATLKQILAEQERKVREFKERYMGELPQQQEVNLRTLDRLQLERQSVADQIQRVEERQLLLQAQVARFDGGSGAAAPGGVLARALRGQNPVRARLDEARAALVQLQSRYTDLHPDVARAKRQVEELEALAQGRRTHSAGTAPAAESPDASQATAVDEVRQVLDPVYQQVEAQFLDTEQEIRHLRESQRRVLAQIQRAQRRVENVPKLEQQLTELTRDYNNTLGSYQSLLSKKLDAQIAENLEKRQKGEQFRVLDPATLPQTPYSPDRRRILAIGLLLGLGVGLGGALGLEVMNQSVRGPRDLKALVPRLPLLGTIPVFADPAAIRRRRLVGLAAGLLFVVAYTAAAATAAHYKDEIIRLGALNVFLK